MRPLLLAALLLAGCASEPEVYQGLDTAPRTIRVTGFTMYERAKVLQAVNYWNARGAKLTAVDDGPYDKAIMAQRDPTKFPGKAGITVVGTFAFVNTEQLRGADFTCVAIHEVGHLLGLGHSEWGVMAPVASATRRCE